MVPPWLWISTPLKFSLWLGNRLSTGVGAFFFWRRFRARRLIWVWLFLINAASLSALGLVFFWLYHRSRH